MSNVWEKIMMVIEPDNHEFVEILKNFVSPLKIDITSHDIAIIELIGYCEPGDITFRELNDFKNQLSIRRAVNKLYQKRDAAIKLLISPRNNNIAIKKIEHKTESPVEAMFLNAVSPEMGIVSQFNFHNYRIDFAIPDKKVAIEIDGHDHHVTKEQRAQDYKRERFLQENGWLVIRFTGAEIFNETSECVASVKRIVHGWGL